MKLFVIRKMDEYRDCWACRIIEGPEKYQTVGQTIYVDLSTDKGRGFTKQQKDELIGKVVECAYTYPHVSIAIAVHILSSTDES